MPELQAREATRRENWIPRVLPGTTGRGAAAGSTRSQESHLGKAPRLWRGQGQEREAKGPRTTNPEGLNLEEGSSH